MSLNNFLLIRLKMSNGKTTMFCNRSGSDRASMISSIPLLISDPALRASSKDRVGLDGNVARARVTCIHALIKTDGVLICARSASSILAMVSLKPMMSVAMFLKAIASSPNRGDGWARYLSVLTRGSNSGDSASDSSVVGCWPPR